MATSTKPFHAPTDQLLGDTVPSGSLKDHPKLKLQSQEWSTIQSLSQTGMGYPNDQTKFTAAYGSFPNAQEVIDCVKAFKKVNDLAQQFGDIETLYSEIKNFIGATSPPEKIYTYGAWIGEHVRLTSQGMYDSLTGLKSNIIHGNVKWNQGLLLATIYGENKFVVSAANASSIISDLKSVTSVPKALIDDFKNNNIAISDNLELTSNIIKKDLTKTPPTIWSIYDKSYDEYYLVTENNKVVNGNNETELVVFDGTGMVTSCMKTFNKIVAYEVVLGSWIADFKEAVGSGPNPAPDSLSAIFSETGDLMTEVKQIIKQDGQDIKSDLQTIKDKSHQLQQELAAEAAGYSCLAFGAFPPAGWVVAAVGLSVGIAYTVKSNALKASIKSFKNDLKNSRTDVREKKLLKAAIAWMSLHLHPLIHDSKKLLAQVGSTSGSFSTMADTLHATGQQVYNNVSSASMISGATLLTSAAESWKQVASAAQLFVDSGFASFEGPS